MILFSIKLMYIMFLEKSKKFNYTFKFKKAVTHNCINSNLPLFIL